MKEKFLPHFQFINQFTKETLHCMHVEVETNKISEFVFGLLDRLNKASFFHVTYFENLNNYIFLEFSRGITIRAIMMDMLITVKAISLVLKYHENLKEESAKEIIDYVETVFADGNKSTKDYFKELFDAGKIDDSKYQQLHRSVNDLIKDLESEGKTKINIKKLYQDVNEYGLGNALRIYDRYLYYSKLDHYSRAYSLMVNRSQVEMEKEWLIDLENMLAQNYQLHYLLVTYFPSNDFLKTQFEKSESYVDKFRMLNASTDH